MGYLLRKSEKVEWVMSMDVYWVEVSNIPLLVLFNR